MPPQPPVPPDTAGTIHVKVGKNSSMKIPFLFVVNCRPSCYISLTRSKRSTRSQLLGLEGICTILDYSLDGSLGDDVIFFVSIDGGYGPLIHQHPFLYLGQQTSSGQWYMYIVYATKKKKDCVVMVQSHSAIHGAIVIDFIPLLWKAVVVTRTWLMQVGHITMRVNSSGGFA